MTRGPFRSLLSQPRAQKSASADDEPSELHRTASRAGEGTSKPLDVRESGIVPARSRNAVQGVMPRALSLRAPRPSARLAEGAHRHALSQFGSAIAGGGDMLLIGSRLQQTRPFATLYRVTSKGVIRERMLRGALGHGGPSLATDGVRVAVGQPGAVVPSAPDGRPSQGAGNGFVSVYRRGAGELELEATLELKPDDPACARFGQVVVIHEDLLVLGQPGSICVYRHSAVGWLSAGTLQPTLPYEWNPNFGLSFSAVAGRVLVGNPVEIDGHRAGPGRVFVYRQEGDHMELEAELLGDGIEGGRDSEPRLGFGASIEVAGDFVLISAPYELSPSGSALSRIYVYRVHRGSLTRVATLDVPSCRSLCLIGERLFVLGDELYVFARRGNAFEPLATYPVNGASAAQVTLARCGALLALGYPDGDDESHTGEVSLHFPDQL